MSDEIEQKIRSIRQRYSYLKSGITDYHPLDRLKPRRGLRLGGGTTLCFPHEGLLDAFQDFAAEVWHFKDYLKEYATPSQRSQVEKVANVSLCLKVVADIANRNKHARLDRARSGRNPRLGLLRPDAGESPRVVQFDATRHGMIEFCYNGRNKTHCIFASVQGLPIYFHTEVIVDGVGGPESLGDAAAYIWSAFGEWVQLLPSLGIAIRADRVVV